jgi:hypothetical protein
MSESAVCRRRVRQLSTSSSSDEDTAASSAKRAGSSSSTNTQSSDLAGVLKDFFFFFKLQDSGSLEIVDIYGVPYRVTDGLTVFILTCPKFTKLNNTSFFLLNRFQFSVKGIIALNYHAQQPRLATWLSTSKNWDVYHVRPHE